MFHSENSIPTILFTLTYTQIQKKSFSWPSDKSEKNTREKLLYLLLWRIETERGGRVRDR